jgi:diguanylate cyclase (GGDEF)-like protein
MTERSGETQSDSGHRESNAQRRRTTTTRDVMSVDLVSAFAGDRELKEAEGVLVRRQKKSRGAAFFSDLLYSVSHHPFAPEIAEPIWDRILSHKHQLSDRLGRNVGVAVAALDYLSNVTSELRASTLISEARFSEMANLAMRDGMTGLFNHSSCYELLELEFGSHRRYGVGVAVLLLDIDAFKLVNDSNGHQEGDRILVAVAEALRDEARDSDICCRIGGDEFAVILRLTNDPVEACDIAERIRAKAAGIACDGYQVAVSVGVALSDHLASSPRALMERADRALYEAKLAGRNCVVLGVPE